MLRIFILTFITINCSAFAQTLSCQWEDSPGAYPKNFYRAASFDLYIEKNLAFIEKDTYFWRKYTPCWNKAHGSCSFLFGADYDVWFDITKMTDKVLVIEQSLYFSAMIKMNFDKKISELKTSESTGMKLSADDGDGVSMDNELFTCVAH